MFNINAIKRCFEELESEISNMNEKISSILNQLHYIRCPYKVGDMVKLSKDVAKKKRKLNNKVWKLSKIYDFNNWIWEAVSIKSGEETLLTLTDIDKSEIIDRNKEWWKWI